MEQIENKQNPDENPGLPKGFKSLSTKSLRPLSYVCEKQKERNS